MVDWLVWIGAITVTKSAKGFVFYYIHDWAVYALTGIVVGSPLIVYGAQQLIDLVGYDLYCRISWLCGYEVD